MSSSKRRKIETLARPKNISAFAARKQLKTGQNGGGDTAEKIPSKEETIINSQEELLFNGILLKSSEETARTLRAGFNESSMDNKNSNGDLQVSSQIERTSGTLRYDEEEIDVTKTKSREVDAIPLLHQTTTQMTTLKPSPATIKESDDGSLMIKIAPGERLVALGEYRLSVVAGHMTILGATLSASNKIYQVSALSSHSLPVIRCPSNSDGARIRVYQSDTGFRALRQLSPLFHKLSNESFRNLPYSAISQQENKPLRQSTFHILYAATAGTSRSYLWPVISPPEWNEAIATILLGKKRLDKRAVTMICGPKSSGKSTFSKLFINRFLTENSGPALTQRKASGVAFLDLDPGQPEYSPQGHLSLIHLLQPNLGPPYSHPVATYGCNRSVRAHSIGAISPSADPDLYMACVTELLAQYKGLLLSNPGCPLVINTPGWILGTGLEILISLIETAKPTEILYMSTEGPWDVVNSLKEAASDTPVFTLPSQLSDYTTRTAAHLRTMQMMSYFHLEYERKKGLSWNSSPLTSVPPWEVKYAGENPGIMGIMCLGEQPPIEMLAASINGTVLSVVVLDSMTALQSLGENKPRDCDQQKGKCNKDSKKDDLKEFANLEQDSLVLTPEKIPYFNPNKEISLDPRHSYSIGLALVRGIDSQRKCLQLLTPIHPDTIAEATQGGQSIVLVSSKLDTPGWAYTEELNKRVAMDKKRRNQQTADMSESSEESDDGEESKADLTESIGNDFEAVPWIEKLEGHGGRGVGARVWRVRRDLGRTGDGGD